jgi:SAM-dependent methyltransferase
VLYRLKVRVITTRPGAFAWRRWHAARGGRVGSYAMLPDLVRAHAPGRTFADVGCMWGVNGEYSFVAEAAGATRVTGIDVFGPTPEFSERRERTGSRVEFVLGDIGSAGTVERVGETDVVLCAGVLYHHPAPYLLLVALRRLCTGTLILRSSTIPEVGGVRGMAVFWPHLDEDQRRLWSLRRLGMVAQLGITTPFEDDEGYGNWFWGPTPSALTALMRLAGFAPQEVYREALATTVVARAGAPSFGHRMLDDEEAARLAADISRTGRARPA